MTAASSPRQSDAAEPDATARIGGWLFRHRTAVPLPMAIALLTLRIGQAPPNPWLTAGGIALTAGGELLRLWAVRHIGTVSRTRSERLGPLVATGPFAHVRNPLYIGNIALWTGLALTTRLVWLAPVAIVVFGTVYHVIVRWEERLLDSRLGNAYRAYAARVPRWFPAFNRTAESPRSAALFSWRDTLFSERGTLIAIAAAYLLIWLKLESS
jgi:protein-S-isoprenylcysteine O-methyltransferase Ste14